MASIEEQFAMIDPSRFPPTDTMPDSSPVSTEGLKYLEYLRPYMLEDSVTDILINGPDRVFVERYGKLEHVPVVFPSDAALLELGAASERYHREIGETAGKSGFAMLAFVGQDARWMAEAAEAAGMPHESVLLFPDSGTAAEHVREIVREGDLVLVKASRGIKLEVVAKALAAEPQQGAGRKVAS